MKEVVYIIGGSGFIGKHLSVYLSRYFNVSVFDRYIDYNYFTQYPSIKLYKFDIIKEDIFNDIEEAPTYIINLASTLVTADRAIDNIDTLISDNINIIKKIFEAYRNKESLKLFVQFGSIEEYGDGAVPLIETQREIPNSTYALLKQIATNYSILLNKNFGFPVAVIRPGNLFGKGQNPQRFIPYVLDKLKNNEIVKVTGCEQCRDFIYIYDFVELVYRLLLNHKKFIGEIVNISSGISIKLKYIIETMKYILKSNSAIEYGAIPYRKNEIMDLRCDITKLENLLETKININPIIRLEEYIINENK